MVDFISKISIKNRSDSNEPKFGPIEVLNFKNGLTFIKLNNSGQNRQIP